MADDEIVNLVVRTGKKFRRELKIEAAKRSMTQAELVHEALKGFGLSVPLFLLSEQSRTQGEPQQ